MQFVVLGTAIAWVKQAVWLCSIALHANQVMIDTVGNLIHIRAFQFRKKIPIRLDFPKRINFFNSIQLITAI